MSSNSANASRLGLWIVEMMVVPPSARRRRAAMTSSDVDESSPDVGSSRSRTRGSETSASAMLTRFACPPLMPRWSTDPTFTSRHAYRSSVRRSASTRACASHLLMPSNAAVYRSISHTVRLGSKLSCCST
mmetsp:Transcript_2665/g.6711  ORF Transcript_2665/g.6711 Transcript_2665/m.6711 type:complete len:131 (+) Transcript_2665:372-764(+)